MRMTYDAQLLDKQTAAALDSLADLERKIRIRVLRKSARAGGAVFLTAMKKAVPVVNMGLRKSLILQVRTGKSGNVFALVGQDLGKTKKSGGKTTNNRKKFKGGGISAQGKTVPDHLVDMPTRAHTIRPYKRRDNAKAVSFTKGKGRKTQAVYGPKWKHPGTSGASFVEATYRASQAKADQAATTKLIIETAREVDTVAKEIKS